MTGLLALIRAEGGFLGAACADVDIRQCLPKSPRANRMSEVPEHDVQADQAVLRVIKGGRYRADNGKPECLP